MNVWGCENWHDPKCQIVCLHSIVLELYCGLHEGTYKTFWLIVGHFTSYDAHLQ